MMGLKLVWLTIAVVVLQVIYTEVRAAGLNRADILANVKFTDRVFAVGGEKRRSSFDGDGAQNDFSSSPNPAQEQAASEEPIKIIREGLRNLLKSINRLVREASDAMARATEAMLGLAQAGLQNATLSWNTDIVTLAQRASALSMSIVPCSAQEQSLQNVFRLLRIDARACAQNATVTVRADVSQFTNIEEQTLDLAQNVTQLARRCFRQGPLMTVICGYQVISDLSLGGVKLVGDASLLSVQLAAALLAVPLQGGSCVLDALNDRTSEAATIVNNISQCVQDSVRNSTVITN